MAQTSLIQVRVDDALKKDADNLFAELGLDTPTAIRMFLKQALLQQAVPFDVALHIPNAATLEAMEEARRIAKDTAAKGYTDVEVLLKELKEDE